MSPLFDLTFSCLELETVVRDRSFLANAVTFLELRDDLFLLIMQLAQLALAVVVCLFSIVVAELRGPLVFG